MGPTFPRRSVEHAEMSFLGARKNRLPASLVRASFSIDFRTGGESLAIGKSRGRRPLRGNAKILRSTDYAQHSTDYGVRTRGSTRSWFLSKSPLSAPGDG